ncbi:lysozyme inhibitor LprI family protein [Nevskia soli]|uniref:lysozyme inhibitor LprI family protein n=1 Tax=Nevskia soli TaxID=418856 RepID=UPI000A004038|nr:lysozyme inhibitor LprI family protein [Nevskia soli]
MALNYSRSYVAATILVGLMAQPLMCGASGSQAADEDSKDLDCSGAPDQRTSWLCAKRDFAALDTQLNAVYRKLKSSLNKDDAQRLVVAQRAWLTYVNADCLFSPGPPPNAKGTFSAFPNTLYALQHQNCQNGHWETRLKILQQDVLDLP